MHRKLIAGKVKNPAAAIETIATLDGIPSDCYEVVGRELGQLGPFQGNLHTEARQAVDILGLQIGKVFPLVRSCSFEAGFHAFLFSQQFRIVLDDLLTMLEAMAAAGEASELILWNLALPTGYLDSKRCMDIKVRGHVTDQRKRLNRSLHRLLAAFQSPQLPRDALVQGTPILVLGSQIDVRLGLEYLDTFSDENAYYLLLKRDDERLVENFRKARPNTTILGTFALSQLESPVEQTAELYKEFKRLLRTNPGLSKDVVSLVLPRLIRSLANGVAVEDFLRRIRPRFIFGTFEKSPLGVVLSSLKEHLGYQLISYQHGALVSAKVMDYMNFDVFYVWDTAARELIAGDGYRNIRSVEILDLRRNDQRNPVYQPPRHARPAWVPRGRCVAFLEQPLRKSPYSLSDYEQIMEVLFRLATKHRFTLVVKPHPNMLGDIGCRASLPTGTRLLRLPMDIGMDEVLRACDFAISLTSTALADFRKVGKPAISFDSKSWGRMVGMPPGLATYDVKTEPQLDEVVGRLCGLKANVLRLLDIFRRRLLRNRLTNFGPKRLE